MIRQVLLSALLICSGTLQGAVELEDTRINGLGLSLSIGVEGVGASVFSLKYNAELSLTATVVERNDRSYELQADTRLHLRRFFKDQIGGWYYGVYVQQSRLEGKLEGRDKSAKQTKTGLGAELGYASFRVLGHKELYRAVGIGVNHYLGAKEQEIFESNDLTSDTKNTLFLDLLRIGGVF